MNQLIFSPREIYYIINLKTIMKNILIAGGAGFIGSHLCERLLQEGNKVVCLDNFSTGNLDNVSALTENPYFKLIEHDITRSPYHIPTGHIDEIYNLACPASPIHYQASPIETTKTSVLGTLNLLELARQHRCKILQASTSEVYGDAEVTPQPEDYWGHVNPHGIRSCYDEGKRCAESLCMNYHRLYNIPVKIIRIFNTYGPRMSKDDGRVVSNFIVQALQGKPLTIYGDGTQTRSFQYIDDLIDGISRIMATPDNITGPVNLGNPCEITIKQLADIILKLTKSASSIFYRELPQDDPYRRKPDISLAHKILNKWTPKIGLEEGTKKTIEHFQNVLFNKIINSNHHEIKQI